MATVPTLVFTTLPNGYADGFYRFSVHVAPRLDPPGSRLEDYSLGNWPEAVAKMAASQTFWLQFESAANPLIPAAVDTSKLRPDLWDELFPAATTFVSVSTTPRTLPLLASIRWIVGKETPARSASVCWSMPRRARPARICVAVIRAKLHTSSTSCVIFKD